MADTEMQTRRLAAILRTADGALDWIGSDTGRGFALMFSGEILHWCVYGDFESGEHRCLDLEPEIQHKGSRDQVREMLEEMEPLSPHRAPADEPGFHHARRRAIRAMLADAFAWVLLKPTRRFRLRFSADRMHWCVFPADDCECHWCMEIAPKGQVSSWSGRAAEEIEANTIRYLISHSGRHFDDGEG